MGKLIIRLDFPCSFYLVESGQLLLANALDPLDVNQLLHEVGDYPVDEVCVYLKPDSRSGLQGVKVDHIKAEITDYDFFVSHEDHAFVKAVAFVFKAGEVKYFSAFRYYQTLVSDGVVVDYFGEYDFIVANIKEGLYRNFLLCSVERLPRSVANCNSSEIIYAAKGAIPDFLNLEHIPEELYETLSFLDFVLNSSPCCVVNVDSGEMLTYGDQGEKPVFHVLSEGEKEAIVSKVKGHMKPIVRRTKRKFSMADVGVAGILLLSAACLALTLFVKVKIVDDFTVLETKQLEQQSSIRNLRIEHEYLLESVELFDSLGLYDRLTVLSSTINHGSIVNVRFISGGMEITLLTIDEDMKESAIADLEEAYLVNLVMYERDIVDTTSEMTLKQYNVVLRYR